MADHQPTTIMIMVGLVGSGKSTFARNLIQMSPLPWQRVNQDTIGNGRHRGTREQCIAAATQHIRRGNSVIIDRTNVTPDQRRSFIELRQIIATAPSAVYAVFLNLPSKQCGKRAASRRDHEGGVNGNAAYPVVGQMNKALIYPKKEEGFDAVFECRNDDEIEELLNIMGEGYLGFDKETRGVMEMMYEERIVKKRKNSVKDLASEPQYKGSSVTIGNKGEKDLGHDHGIGRKRATNAFEVLMQSAARAKHDKYLSPMNKRKTVAAAPTLMIHDGSDIGGENDNKTAGVVSVRGKVVAQPSPSRHIFGALPMLTALSRYIEHPERLANSMPFIPSLPPPPPVLDRVLYDDRCVAVADKFPKARIHGLVIARDQSLLGPLDLKHCDVDLVKHMKIMGHQWATSQYDTSAHEMKYGFHSVPSMKHLHLHVVSTDFKSPCLKKKRHWISFTSSFFLDVDWVIEQLETQGRLEYDVDAKEALLKGSMHCHRCGCELKTMSMVKEHLSRGC